jgi:hypothetical protein
MTLWDSLTRIIWRPGLGDNNWAGWLTVGLYYGVGLWAFWRSYRQHHRDRHFYLGLALLLLLLGGARQFGLLRWITEWGREVARLEGWYTTRWWLQRRLVWGGGYAGLALFGWLAWHNRRQLRQRGAILLGVVFLVSFVAIRAVSFHNMDVWLSRRRWGMPGNTLLEVGALLWIALALAIAAQQASTDVSKTHLYRTAVPNRTGNRPP